MSTGVGDDDGGAITLYDLKDEKSSQYHQEISYNQLMIIQISAEIRERKKARDGKEEDSHSKWRK